MKRSVPSRNKHVFINCPFDEAYTPMLRIIAERADLGQAEEIGKVFRDFQKYLYQEVA